MDQTTKMSLLSAELKKESTPSGRYSPTSLFEEAERFLQFTEMEHSLGFWQAAKLHWPAVALGLFINLATVLKGMHGGPAGSPIGLQPFKENYGYRYNGDFVIAAHWVSLFNYANKLGAIAEALLSGYAYDELGVERMMAICSTCSIGFIFLQFVSHTPAQLFAGELINGCIITIYPICASAYIGEVCPLALRGFAASMTNLAFVIGQFIASGILKGTNGIVSKYSYKIPIATKYALPAIMMTIIFFCPDPPYWLYKKAKYEAAKKTLVRLATSEVNPSLKLAHIKETLRPESTFQEKERLTVLDCFPQLPVMAYDMRAFTGNNLFIDYAVYFFKLAGLDSSDALSMKLGLTAIGFVDTCLAWPLLYYVGRHRAYFWGCAGLTVLLFLIRTIDVAPRATTAPTWAQCTLMLICNFIYDVTIGPFCFVLLAEVSSAKLRGMTIALATVTCHIVSILFSVAISYAINEDEGDWRGKLGFLLAGFSFSGTLYCLFFLPEMKGRTFEELDIMFERKVPSRKFKDNEINSALEAREELHVQDLEQLKTSRAVLFAGFMKSVQVLVSF